MGDMAPFLIWLFGSIIFIAAYDVYLICKKGKQKSISAYIIRYSKKFPSIPFLSGFILGFLSGHLFWSMDNKDWEL